MHFQLFSMENEKFMLLFFIFNIETQNKKCLLLKLNTFILRKTIMYIFRLQDTTKALLQAATQMLDETYRCTCKYDSCITWPLAICGGKWKNKDINTNIITLKKQLGMVEAEPISPSKLFSFLYINEFRGE